MFEIKDIIEAGIQDGKNAKDLLNILTESIDGNNTKLETFEKVYNEVYSDNHLCDRLCVKMVEMMYNNQERGQKWTLEQTNEIARKIGVSFSNDDYTPYEFWTAMHMVYYDYSESLAESGINDPLIYGKLADAYLDDPDAPEGKLVNYFFFIAKSDIK